MATMHDVARLARVSVSTVSYVLTGTRPISESTRTRVLAAMAELDYEPHAMARGLASRHSRILGLLRPLGQRGMGATETAFVTAAASAAATAGYLLVLSPGAADDLATPRRLASQRILDGALLMEVQLEDQRVEVLTDAGVPVVLIGRTADPGDLSYVDIDFDQTVQAAVAHLTDLGHREIVFVNHSTEDVAVGYGPALRAGAAFDAAMSQRGLEPVTITSGDSAADGRHALREALSRCPDLTAVLALNENALFGILSELAGLGLAVPEDVSVISMVTAQPVADLATPPLTTLASPGATIGRLAVETLVRLIHEGPAAAVHQQLVPCALEVRRSTGPPPSPLSLARRRRTPPPAQEARRQPPSPLEEIPR